VSGSVLLLLLAWSVPAGLATVLLTGVVRRYAVARAVLDHPNERSSHAVPTPRGGGVAIAVSCLGGIAAAAAAGIVPVNAAVALVGGGALISLVGWVDDHQHVNAAIRAAVHFAAAAWALWWLDGLPALRIGEGTVPLGWMGAVLAAVAIVWCVNLFNFMDGIDGIAGGEALSVGLAGGAFLIWAGHPGMAVAAWLVAAAGAGFLAWNWAPARIFMGDVGSGLLGYLFAVLALASERVAGVPLLLWVLLGGVFIFDATATLLRRAARGERWHQAHRSHAYQRMVQSGWSHARTSAGVLVLNAILALLAAAALVRPALLLPSLAAGLILLAFVYLAVERRKPM
jgi:Fuc2NAc and GlcNAc transferase